MEFSMPSATVLASAQGLPNIQSLDAALISLVTLYAEAGAAFLALPDETHAEIFEAGYNQCSELGAAVSRMPAVTNEGLAAKVSIAPLAFELDSEPALCRGPSSFTGLWQSIRTDLSELAGC
jgi:hypothetical protein